MNTVKIYKSLHNIFCLANIGLTIYIVVMIKNDILFIIPHIGMVIILLQLLMIFLSKVCYNKYMELKNRKI